MIYRRLNLILTTLAIGLVSLAASDRALADSMRTSASGIGTFLPRAPEDPAGPGGDYFGSGVEPELGNFIHNGSLDLIPIRPLKFRFQNAGRGTDQEVLHEVMYEDGSTIKSRFRGIVELDPMFDDQGNPTGLFTAEWNGTWVYVGGTGRFRNAKGSNRVTAINDPFSLTDFAWNFDFTWTGNLTLPNNRDHANIVELSTVGEGCFAPANIGRQLPLPLPQLPFPLVIGDGSGEGIYDGTPEGEASLDGIPIGPDQHWGTAQSIRPGNFSLAGTIWYPGISGANPRRTPAVRRFTSWQPIWAKSGSTTDTTLNWTMWRARLSVGPASRPSEERTCSTAQRGRCTFELNRIWRTSQDCLLMACHRLSPPLPMTSRGLSNWLTANNATSMLT